MARLLALALALLRLARPRPIPQGRRSARSLQHAPRRHERPAGAQRLSADDPPAGRPLHRLYRPPRRHARRAEADEQADRNGGVQRHLDPRRHRSGQSEIPEAPPRPRRELRGGRRADGARLRRRDAAERATSPRPTCCASSAGRRTRSGTSPTPAKPALLARIGEGIRDTHKNWWECDTGIAYLVSGAPGWRTRRMMQVYDLSDPAQPKFIRDFGLVGQQPGTEGTVPTELHGAISTGPQGNRLYFGYGTNKGGVLQILDREKLLNGPKEVTPDNLRHPVIGELQMSPLVGAHTVLSDRQGAHPGIRRRQVRRRARHGDDRRRVAGQRMRARARRGRSSGSSMRRSRNSRWWCRTTRRTRAISASAAGASARIPRTRAWRRCSAASSPS